MQCPQCQHANREGARFCGECGTPLPVRCPACGIENRPGAKFCNACGTLLTSQAPVAGPPRPAMPPATEYEREPLSYTPQHLTEKILTSRSALQGERKQVTVLFADIKDSTELIKDLDPEAAQQLLDPAIRIMMDADFYEVLDQVLALPSQDNSSPMGTSIRRAGRRCSGLRSCRSAWSGCWHGSKTGRGRRANCSLIRRSIGTSPFIETPASPWQIRVRLFLCEHNHLGSVMFLTDRPGKNS